MRSASCGRADILAALLHRRASVDTQELETGTSALITAARNGRSEAITTLLQHGARWTMRDLQGLTAFDWAERNGNVACKTLLQAAGGEISSKVMGDISAADVRSKSKARHQAAAQARPGLTGYPSVRAGST